MWQGLGNHDTDPEKVLFIVDDRACVVAFSAPHKPTYVFSAINPDSAIALLEFGTYYAQSQTGNIPHQQFPEPLKEVAITLRELRSDRQSSIRESGGNGRGVAE